MHKRRQIAAIVTLVLALGATFNAMRPTRASTNRPTARTASTRAVPTKNSEAPGNTSANTASSNTASSNRTDPRLRGVGFRSAEKLRQHFLKHGREFGAITQSKYLAMAQDLRDAPLSKTVLEAAQVGGTISRFNRSTGAFMAFDPDLTIRTFFRPDDGEAYFIRAARRPH